MRSPFATRRYPSPTTRMNNDAYAPAGLPAATDSFASGIYRIDTRFVVGQIRTREVTFPVGHATSETAGSGSGVAFGGFASQLGMQLRGLVGSRASIIGTPTIAVALPDPSRYERLIVMSAEISVAPGQTVSFDDINRVTSRAVSNSIALSLNATTTMPADGRPLFDLLMANGGPRNPVYVSGSTTVTRIAAPTQGDAGGSSQPTDSGISGTLVAVGVGVALIGGIVYVNSRRKPARKNPRRRV